MAERFTPNFELTDALFGEQALEYAKASDTSQGTKNNEGRKDRLHQIQERLVEQQHSVAELIVSLYDTVRSASDRGALELLLKKQVTAALESGEISAAVAKHLYAAIENFRTKQATLHDFVTKHKADPYRMFEECFGGKAIGKVEIVQGSMTLTFRCYEDDDYVTTNTYTLDTENLDYKQKFAEQRNLALKTIGTAFSESRVPGLAGSIVSERVAQNYTYTHTYEKYVETLGLSNNWRSEQYPNSEEGNMVRLLIEGQDPIEMQLLRNEKGEVHSCSVVARMAESELLIGAYNNLKSGESVNIDAGHGRVVELKLATRNFFIKNKSGIKVGIERTVSVNSEKTIKDESLSKNIELHEDQHQFNKLFKAEQYPPYINLPQGELERVEDVLKYALDKGRKVSSDTIVREFSKVLARAYRRTYIDARARDEILAYTINEPNTAAFLQLLDSHEVYDYKERDYTHNETTIPYKQLILQETEQAVKYLFDDGFISVANGQKDFYYFATYKYMKNVHVEDKALIADAVEEVLGVEYKKQLRRWVGAVQSMEKAGYSRDYIVSYLGTLPVGRWKSNVRRLLKYKSKPSE